MTYEEAIEILQEERNYAQFPKYVKEALEIAISVIEKQIPKKPKRINKNSIFDGNWKMICPCCGAMLIECITTETQSYPIQYNMTEHCMCGQALDWSDTE